MARWFRCGLSVAGSFVCRCLTSPTMLRFHFPLIKPDVRYFPHPAFGQGLMLSPTERCGRLAETARPNSSYRDVVGIARDPRPHLVLSTQPPTEPFAGMSGYNPIWFTDGSLAKVVRPSNHDAVELATTIPCSSPV